jgi:chromosome partitioning protein
MTIDETARTRVIVVGNEKGGSGKSTVAMNIAVALLKQGQRVGTIDLDPRQRTFTTYIENRRAWGGKLGRNFEIPDHICVEKPTEDRPSRPEALSDAVGALFERNEFIVIDSAGHDSDQMRLALAMADILVTPLNDSFVDFDLLGRVDPASFAVTGSGPYADLVGEARGQRRLLGQAETDWIVLRNRLTAIRSRNKRLMGEGLEELSRRLNFRCVDGLAERVIFREFYPRGLTAVDDLDKAMLGTRPTMSHLTARIEVENLLNAMDLAAPAADETVMPDRDAA